MTPGQPHFDEVAAHYDESLPAHVREHYLEKRARYLAERVPPPARVLDVGCGTGVLAGRLAGLGYEVVGVDPSGGMLGVMRENFPGVGAVQGSGTELPFAAGEFDLALTVATLHHTAAPGDVERTLGEMARVVRSGGHVLVWDHNPRNPYWPRIMRRVPQDHGEERLVPLVEIERGLRAGGAEPVEVAQTGLVPDFTPRPLLGAAALLERLAERTPGIRGLCAHNVVLAVKR
jgi:ubiquinone/menaquinone biosynthesis C-methylase UbiE